MAEHLTTSVLIIGAGPAGSSAARLLASLGIDVVLVDRAAFPRDKVCGDALIPDALHALDRLSLRERVLAHAFRAHSIRVYTPKGRCVSLRGECACIPRYALDDLLRAAAVESGARFLEPYTAVRPLDVDGTVRGAVVRHNATGQELRVSAQVTLLATGADAQTLRLFGMATRINPSALAGRSYFRLRADLPDPCDYLAICYDRAIAPGYGWVFPGPDNIFNVGVGYFMDTPRRTRRHNIRELWESFKTSFPLVQSIVANSEQIGALKGALLRTAMAGAQLARPGLFVIGEAAGLTYSFSGEGIGKAMESGLIAAEVAAKGLGAGASAASMSAAYSTEITATFRERFRAYKIAQDWLAHPFLADFLAWRAHRGSHVRTQLEGLLSETTDPRALFSLSGLVRAVVQ